MMGKIHTVRKSTTMQQIAETKALPIVARPVGADVDAKLQGTLLAQEVFATLKGQYGTWTTFAHRVFAMSIEARNAFSESVKGQLKAMRGEVARVNYGADKDKNANREVRVATVQVSRLTKIAEACNKGASMIGLGKFYGVADPQNVGYNRAYDYAVAYLSGVAANKGRPATLLVAKCTKWLETMVKTPAKGRTDDMAQRDAVFAKALAALIAEHTPADAE